MVNDSSGQLLKISERKKAEGNSQSASICFKLWLRFPPVGIFRTTSDGETIYVNPRWSELSGLSQDEASGNNWIDAVHPEDRKKVMEN